ncbi:MAG: 3-methylornithyl-N6-L-lysine dehydrogenase PylD [Desulfosarcinaceae bacterium]|nr:3-methylornithyl-N6-L-lysine dehydrogenase PylD [Desulfosarcinaceae bacterium]
MTRLTRADLRNLEGSLAAYEHYLNDATGIDLAGLALEASGLPADTACRNGLADLRLAVIPVTIGLGIIGGFSQSVAAILNHLGCHSYVTKSCDVAGITEALARGAAALFLSDDSDFVALDPERRVIVHNTAATARGFVAGLARMAGGVVGREVLVIGCGALGGAAAEALLTRGAHLVLTDHDPAASAALAASLRAKFGQDAQIRLCPHTRLDAVDLIFDASNTGDHIDVEMMGPATCVAAPGMPCGVTAAGRRRLGIRMLHDPLQIGVATMAGQIYAAQLCASCMPAEGTLHG